jgi:MSHA biogenesis protein MshE
MRFGEFLTMHGVITQEQLDHALGFQKEGGVLLGESLVHLGYMAVDDLDQYLEEHLLIQADDIVRENRSELSY